MRPLIVPDAPELRNALMNELRHYENARYLHRLHCLVLVEGAYSCDKVAKCFGESARSIERWIHRFEDQGLEGLSDHRTMAHPGSRTLTQPQLNSLGQDLRKNPFSLGYATRRWTGKLLRSHLEHRYGVTFSLRHCQRLLRKRIHESPQEHATGRLSRDAGCRGDSPQTRIG